MRTVILADGAYPSDHKVGGGYRHLFEIEGEVLLHRTVRQFAELGEVILLAPPVPEYDIPPAVHVTPDPCRSWGGIAMFGKALPFLSLTGRSNVVFGDVWFSDDAIEKIATHGGDWQVFGRPGPSTVTGTPYGEYFCYTLYPEHRKEFVRAMGYAYNRWARDEYTRCTPWEVYWKMEDMALVKQDLNGALKVGPHWTDLVDWTDDFDYDHDVTNWITLRKKAGFGT